MPNVVLRASLSLIIATLSFACAYAQVTVDPPFPQEDDRVTVFFDASQGTGGLKDCGCDVYVHTGVTNVGGSGWVNVATQWAVEDPDWRMTPVPGEDNLYSFTYDIRDFYMLDPGQEIQSINFVFRNGDGSLEGKGPGGTDIFYEIRTDDDYEVVVFDPVAAPVLNVDESFRLYAASTQPSTELVVSVDGVPVASTTNAGAVDTDIVVEAGAHVVEVVGTSAPINGNVETATATLSYFGTANLPAVTAPAGARLGHRRLAGDTHAFQLMAPLKSAAVVTVSSAGAPDVIAQLSPLEDGSGFYGEVDVPGASEIIYTYSIDGSAPIADPFSEIVLDRNQDPFIDASTFPDLPAIADFTSASHATYIPATAPYDWQDGNYVRPAEKDLVIYELLIRDFTEEHSYQSLIDSLDYFTRLGVNAIELMPVNEFEGNLSWGYNPSYHSAIDKYYGTPDDLRRFVDSAHNRGIAVIADVVFNHGFSQNPYVQLYASERAAAPNGAGPFYNVRSRHPFNVGTDANHESPYQKRYTATILQRWIEEYHFDGFRFDLSKGFTQVDYGDNVGAWSNYDASRIAILNEYQDSIRAVDPDNYVILEHFAQAVEERELTAAGMFTWGNMNFNYAEAAMGYQQNSFYGVTPQSRGFDNPRLVGYMESHDEQRILYKVREFGNAAGDYDTKRYTTSLSRVETDAAFFYTTPGAKMLWQFGEYGYDVDINFNGRTGNKPILWDLLEEPANRRLFDVTAALINLRRDYPVFVDGDHQLPSGLETGFFKSMYIEHPDMNAVVVGNFDVVEQTGTSTFPGGGTYYDYFTGDSVQLAAGNFPTIDFTLEPGEYHLYTSERLPEPPSGYLDPVSKVRGAAGAALVSVFPNPSVSGASVRLATDEVIERAVAIDASGRRFEVPVVEGYSLNTASLSAGIYHVHLTQPSGKTALARVVIAD